ncbi:MAG: DUF4340 domain-containing protein [Chitinophagales bacterium]|nr:DUF4340 domain-containing protein [Chitinophagales bacterium]MDW8428689.1 DUF4340 domain-containing protein [Chitinophagales bacterium]
MKAIRLYLLLFLVLVAAAGIVIWLKEPWSTLPKDETAFAVADTAAVYRIAIADMRGRKVVYQRAGHRWKVNDKYYVRKDYMDVLLSTIHRVRIQYPVADAAQATVITSMTNHNKKVEIYDRKGRLLKSYYVGGPTLDNRGTYMLLEGSRRPYVTVIPNFIGTLQSRYSTDEEKVRDTNIFRYRPGEIRRIKLTYTGKPDSSFALEVLAADSFAVSNGLNQILASENMDKKKIYEYLNLFRHLNVETYANELPKKDSILQTTPYCELEVLDGAGNTRSLTCFRMPRTQHTVIQYDREGKPVLFDPDRFYVFIDPDNDFAIIQKFHFGPVFQHFQHFVRK